MNTKLVEVAFGRGEMAGGLAGAYTGDNHCNITLWLFLPFIDISVFLRIDSPTFLRAGSVLNLKFEDTIGLGELVSSEP